jgi:threonine dehydratase
VASDTINFFVAADFAEVGETPFEMLQKYVDGVLFVNETQVGAIARILVALSSSIFAP